jgi:hypothetical protein
MRSTFQTPSLVGSPSPINLLPNSPWSLPHSALTNGDATPPVGRLQRLAPPRLRTLSPASASTGSHLLQVPLGGPMGGVVMNGAVRRKVFSLDLGRFWCQRDHAGLMTLRSHQALVQDCCGWLLSAQLVDRVRDGNPQTHDLSTDS